MVISSLRGGGAERVLSEMANYLAGVSWEVVIITWERDATRDAYPVDGAVARVHLGLNVEASGFLAKLALNARRISALRRAVTKFQPDVLLSFMDTTNVVALLATRSSRLPVVVSERTDPSANRSIPMHWRLLRRLFYGRADVVVAQTRSAADWLQARCRVACEVIPNPVRELPPVGPVSSRDNVVLAVGRLSPEKGVAGLIHAFAQLARSNPDWRLVLVGDGPQRQELAALASELGVERVVDFVGFSANPEQWMATASIFVLNSSFEGFPNSLLEAMAMGLAVVSSDCASGPRELIRDHVNGRLCSVGNTAELARVIQELIDEPGTRALLGLAATRVRDAYARPAVMAQWSQLLTRAARKLA